MVKGLAGCGLNSPPAQNTWECGFKLGIRKYLNVVANPQSKSKVKLPII